MSSPPHKKARLEEPQEDQGVPCELSHGEVEMPTVDRRVHAGSAATLFAAGLHLVFSSLHERELITRRPWLVCHHWLAATRTMPSLQLRADVSTPERAELIRGTSLLAPHVTKLAIRLSNRGQFHQVLEAVGALGDRNIKELHISGAIPGGSSSALDLSPLLGLRQLELLNWNGFVALTPEQLAVIKQFPMLRSLRGFTHEDWAQRVRDLCTPPHALQRLEQLPLKSLNLTFDIMQLLATQVPTLTLLNPQRIPADCLPLLAKFTQLRDLALTVADAPDEDGDETWSGWVRHHEPNRTKFALLSPHLAAFGQIRCLHLGCWNFEEDDEVAKLFAAMPHLDDLALEDSRLPSMLGLAFARSLTALTFHNCPQVSFEDLCSLKVCARRLTRLSVFDHHERGEDGLITDWGEWRISEKQVNKLTPPSKLLPSLKFFTFEVTN